MKLEDLMLLLPGYELDGFPRTASSEQADQLLSGWIAMWHPRLLAAMESIPRWQQVEDPPSELDGKIFIQPSICDATIPDTFQENLGNSTGKLIQARAPWREFQTELLTFAGLDAADLAPVPGDLLERFAALGYAYLQIQLMTRQVRYASSLDLPDFNEHALTASKAALEGDHQRAQEMIGACFDAIGQERDHHYSLDVHLLDLTLLASTTLGKSLGRQLADEMPTSYVAPAGLLRELRTRSAENFTALQTKVAALDACLCGGPEVERSHELLTRDTICRDLQHGRTAYEELGLAAPEIYGRLSFGQTPNAASIQKRFGFSGTLLTALSGGKYPAGSQAKVTWESPDGAFLPAIATGAMDASDPASFLSLGWEIGEALDHQHVPTMVFAHWPGRLCDYHRLMKIVSDHTPALGRWQIASTYFSETDQPYHQERFSASEFVYNWLAEADDAGKLIEATKQFHILAAQARAIHSAACLAWLLENPPAKRTTSPDADSQADPIEEQAESGKSASSVEAEKPVALSDFLPELEQAERQIDGLLDDAPPATVASLRTQLQSLQTSVASRIAAKLLGKTASPKTTASGETARVVLNPYCCPMRLTAMTDSGQALGAGADWHFSHGPVGKSAASRVDVPSCGFVAGKVEKATPPKANVLAESGGLLRNEYIEVQVDTDRGHLRSLHAPGHRGNRLSLQIAMRQIGDDGEPVYSQMDASDVRMLTSSSANGLVRAKGRLALGGKPVGKFEIDYETWRGSRIVELDVKLSELSGLDDGNPWRSAFVLRLAWVNESANLRSHSASGRSSWSSGKTIAPQLIHIDEADYHTHYMTGGLAFHRLMGSRFLETILATRGQESVRHRVGIGVDLPNPTETAASFMHAPMEVAVEPANSFAASSGWLASVSIDTVDLAFECPLVNQTGKNVGVRVLASEHKGTSCGVAIRLLRDVASARRVDYFGNTVSELTTEGDKVTVPLRANENALIDILWA